MKRFRIIDKTGKFETTEHETILEVVKEINQRRENLYFETYYVECLIDEIEINSDELILAWRDGERPEDLQMF